MSAIKEWWSIIVEYYYLVSASRASRLVSGLRVGGTGIGFLTLNHHLLEVDITTGRILVSGLTRVTSGAVLLRRVSVENVRTTRFVEKYEETLCTSITYRRVSIPGLEGVEVVNSTRGVRVPRLVNSLLGLIVPKLSIVSSHFQEKGG